MAGEETATCPSCSLIVKVIYDPVSLICPNYLLKKFSKYVFFQDMFRAEEEEVNLDEKLKNLSLEKNWIYSH